MIIPRASASVAAEAIKAHTGPDGTVWSVDGDGPPRPSGLTPAVYAAGARGRPLRVVAAAENAELLVQLHAHGQAVTLGRPAHVDWADAVRSGPQTVLLRMGTAGDVAPSLGGWRPFTARDLPSYLIAAYLAGRGDPADPVVAAALLDHPCCRPLHFLGIAPGPALAQLVATVLDPRWFVQPEFPESPAKLRCYFGLAAPRDQGSWARRARRRLVRAVWWGDGPPAGAQGSDAPGQYLWRYWCRQRLRRPDQAELRVSRRFLDYLRATWLDAASAHALRLHAAATRYDQGLFLPESFFAGEPDTAAAWRTWMDRPRVRPLGAAPRF